MNTLKIKILGLVAAIVIAIILIVASINYHMQREMLTLVASHHTSILVETIKNSISNVMRSGHSAEIQKTFARIISQKPLKGVRIVDESGRILNSADRNEIGRIIPEEERSHLRIPAAPPLYVSAKGDSNLYDLFSPILNGSECFECHGSTKKILGILEIELSDDYLNDFFARQKNTAILSTLLLMFLIVITIYTFLLFYVDRPIRKLIYSMEQLEDGNFDAKVTITSSTEMRHLTKHFSHMIERFRSMMDATINQERELARAQEKLAHHRETHLMNRKLEEQIQEIEALNISLEERIEEIEEANYKIADLAGELEDKNTNLENAVGRLSTLYKVGLAINSTMEIHKLFSLVVQTTMETLHAQIGYIIIHNAEHRTLKVTTLFGHESTVPEGAEIPMKPSSVSSWVIANRKPLLIADINKAPEFDRFSALGFERKTLICAPLMLKDEIIGTITVVNKIDSSVYNNDELDLLTTIAGQASIAIKNAKLYEDQQKTYMNTIHALVSAVEASDSYTRGHSERVTYLSLELAKKLELPHERLQVIERAAILHDIGKIGVDLSLLNKEGKLSPKDVHNLQQHPIIGMKILEPIDFLQDVRICIGQHHERYDGQGYPNNVPASELLLESRILAIADAFDAMTSNRPYRKALALDVAIKELHDNAGTQFDPDLVPLFEEVLRNNAAHFPEIFGHQFSSLLSSATSALASPA